MSAVIKIKNSSTASAVPTSSDLVQGELAVNVADKRVFTKDATSAIVELGINPSSLTTASATITSLTASGAASFADGSASAPAITNTGDTNTGIFFPAADTIAFAEGGVEAMRLDASGNMGLGTLSPVSRLHIRGTAATKLLINSADNTADRGVYFAAADNTELGYVSQEYSTGTFTISAGTGTYSVPMVFRTSGSERMRLDASGNLLVGSTSTRGSAKLDVRGETIALGANASFYGTIGYNAATGLMSLAAEAGAGINFLSGTTERARIDSSGNLLVGTTNSANNAGTGLKFLPNGLAASVIANSGTASDTWNVYNTTAGAFRFYVTNGGTIFATSTTISAISDERLKENIKDIDTGLDAVMALKPRRFDWKEGKGQDKKNAAGFIAQEFETVFPDSVATSKAGEDGIEYKNICHEELIPTLVKAIQELKTELDAAKARIIALEQ